MQKIEVLTLEGYSFQLLRNSGQWECVSWKYKGKNQAGFHVKNVLTSTTMVPDYYALERTAESGNKHVGWSFIPRFRTWSSIQNDIPGRNVPALNAVVTSGTSSTRGLRRRVRSPLWRSVSVSVGNRGRRPSEEREREEGEEDEGRHGYCGALRVLALYFWFFSAPWSCYFFFFFFFASAQTQVCSHSSLFLLNFLGVFVLFCSSFIFSFWDYLFFWGVCQDC